MEVGDLVSWPQGYCEAPGLVLDMRPAKGNKTVTASMNPSGMAVLAMLPELGNEPEWFHECELECFDNSVNTLSTVYNGSIDRDCCSKRDM